MTGKWQKLLMFVAVFSTVFALLGGRTEAAKVFDGETHSPTSHRTLCDAGTPVDFSAYPSDISLDLDTGVMSYNINVQWAPCSLTNLRAYAIYSVGQEVCPISGTYGASDAQGGVVTDCVKYIGSPAYQGAGNGLSCGAGWYGQPGVNEQCVAQNFAGVRRSENQPTSAGSAVIPMQTVIPNWGAQSDTGSWTVDNAMCQFYKSGANFTTYTNDRCINVVMRVSWKTKVTAPTLSCGAVSTNPSDVEQGQAFSLTGSFNLSGGEGLTGQTTYTMTVSVPAAGITNQAVATDQSTGWSGSGAGTVAGISIPTLGVHPVTYTVSVAGVSGSPQTCAGTVRVAKRPFVSFYGGDVRTGGAFVGGNCSAQAGIHTFTGAGLAGSGVQFAATALGVVTGFNSARLRSTNPGPPNGLTFSNTVGGLGGLFGEDRCIPDYLSRVGSLVSEPATSVDISTVGSRYYDHNVTLAGVIPNVRQTIFIKGDLRITGNITFANTTWANVKDIPALHVYVKGNIYIDPGVTEITGMYVAQPDGATKGTIVTCAKNGNSEYDAAELFDNCNTRLTIKGSLVAQKVRLLRVANSLRDATATSESGASATAATANSRGAEVFEFAPELFIAPPESSSNTSVVGGGYDYFTGLPPIL